MNDDDERHEAFLATHADELREKAAAAAGSLCPACTRNPTPLSLVDDLWLRCENGHTIRCWTEEEIAMMNGVRHDL